MFDEFRSLAYNLNVGGFNFYSGFKGQLEDIFKYHSYICCSVDIEASDYLTVIKKNNPKSYITEQEIQNIINHSCK